MTTSSSKNKRIYENLACPGRLERMSTLGVLSSRKSSNSFLATDIVQCYKDIVVGAVDISVPVAAIKALTHYIQENRANTMIEFTRDLEAATSALLTATQNCVSIKAGCELFTRFVTRSGADTNEVRNLEMKSNLPRLL